MWGAARLIGRVGRGSGLAVALLTVAVGLVAGGMRLVHLRFR